MENNETIKNVEEVIVEVEDTAKNIGYNKAVLIAGVGTLAGIVVFKNRKRIKNYFVNKKAEKSGVYATVDDTDFDIVNEE